MYHRNQLNVGKYASQLDPMGQKILMDWEMVDSPMLWDRVRRARALKAICSDVLQYPACEYGHAEIGHCIVPLPSQLMDRCKALQIQVRGSQRICPCRTKNSGWYSDCFDSHVHRTLAPRSCPASSLSRPHSSGIDFLLACLCMVFARFLYNSN